MPHVLIAGDDALTACVEHEMNARGHSTRRISPELHGITLADLEGADVVMLVDDGDGNNVALALRARRLRPDLPLVVRLFDRGLVRYLVETLPGVRILSMSAITAPLFAAEAQKVLLAPGAAAPRPPAPRRRRSFQVDPVLVTALVCLLVLVVTTAAFFSHSLDLPYLTALYFVVTTITTVGYGDIALKDASSVAKLVGMGVMVSGAAFIAVLFAILSDWVLTRRLDLLHGRTAERGRGHVIVAGAGNIGLRVCGLLAPSAVRLVVVERDAENRNASLLKAAGHHVIVADVTSDDALELAGLHGAALVVALTASDGVNLEVALHARKAGVPVVMRVDSQELAAHVVERGDAIAIAPVVAATSVFCDAALEAATAPTP
jgi:voltage-gated potassium channel Kch